MVLGTGLPATAVARVARAADVAWLIVLIGTTTTAPGLGLYTASEVIRRHGGTITTSAPAGGGTMFAVRLPLAERPTWDLLLGRTCRP
jgi:K+-sensing histidine kinase KdpD